MASNLENALLKINKQYGKGTVLWLGEQEPLNENLLSTGSLLIDKALGGGIAYGRITEIFGAESSGKSTLCLHLVAQCQQNGGTVAYIDTEQALDADYAHKLGVDIDKLIFSQPTSAEEALEVVDILAKSGDVNLIIVDSVAALAPEAELNGEMGDVTMGLVARLMSKACRKLVSTLNEQNCAVIFINQIRDKISTGWSAGPGETTTGGRALKFFSSQRIELRKSIAIKEKDEVIGNNVKIKIVKNKIAPPMKVVEVPLIFGKGFSAGDEVYNLAVEYEIIGKSGAWFTTHDEQRFQGLANVKDYYNQRPELFNQLKEMVINKLKGLDLEATYEIDPETGEVLN